MRGLSKECRIWESLAAQYRQVIQLCEQVTRLGIGIEELIAYHSAVIKRADEECIPIGAAPYRVMMDIDHYNRLGGLKKELANTVMNLQMVNLISARQHIVGNILMRLLSIGITEGQILNACRAIELNGNAHYTRSNNSQFG
jgi:hypothetical protein